MQNCPYCNTEINENYNFCQNCEEQLKCLNCNDYLIKGKSKCLKCGTPLQNTQSHYNLLNTFHLEEEQSENKYSRTVNFSCTDNAIDKVATVFNAYVPPSQPIVQKPISVIQHQTALPPVQELKNEVPIPENDILKSTGTTHSFNGNLPEVSANDPSDYFEIDGQGFLTSLHPDYKGKNKKNQQERFTILYVWAYNELRGEPVPNKEHLNQAAKLNGLYNTNYSNYLNDFSQRFFIKNDGTLKLNPSGKSQVNKIISEMEDIQIKGCEYWVGSRKTGNRSARINKDDERTVEQWLEMSSQWDSFDIRKLKNVEQAILVLFILTKELKVADAIKPGLVYMYLVKKYKTISVKKSNFAATLSTKNNSKYFNQTVEGKYYLTPDAENKVESWSV